MNCDNTAVALLTFSPPEAKAWLYDLDQPDPTGGIMLCRKHANATVVPMSWSLVDGRDPAWPGPRMADDERATTDEIAQTLLADALPSQAVLEEQRELVLELPSDQAVLDQEFAALRDDLPVTPQRYAAEPQLATMRAAGVIPEGSDTLVDLGTAEDTADPSLFELQISDIPAVTRHPNF